MRCAVSHRPTSNAEMSRTCDKQTSTTTNVVDDTVYSFSCPPSWARTTVADGCKFSAVKRLSRLLLDRSKKNNFTCPTFIWCPNWKISPSSFAWIFLRFYIYCRPISFVFLCRLFYTRFWAAVSAYVARHVLICHRTAMLACLCQCTLN